MTIDSLEVKVERAWCALQEIRSKRVVYLTATPGIRFLLPGQQPQDGWHRVGEYSWTVGLDQLRAAVFATYERTWRASHGHGHR